MKQNQLDSHGNSPKTARKGRKKKNVVLLVAIIISIGCCLCCCYTCLKNRGRICKKDPDNGEKRKKSKKSGIKESESASASDVDNSQRGSV